MITRYSSLSFLLWPVALLFLSSAQISSAQVADAPSPTNTTLNQVNTLLNKLSVSLREQNYRGLFTYEMGGVLDTYKIVHRLENGLEYERLYKLNGAEKEILRSGRRSDCLSHGDHLMRRLVRNLQDSVAEKPYYQFSVMEEKRIAGRQATLLQIIPTDKDRYGYVFGLDEESGLPLQVLVIGPDNQVLERIQFVELELGASIPKTELSPSQQNFHHADHESTTCDENWQVEQAPWRAAWLPTGFEYTGFKKTGNDEFMLSYTDGLASFSIFVGPNEMRPNVKGKAQLGATVAALNQQTWNDQLFRVTVVGEIPFPSAQQIAENLEIR